MVNLRNCSFDEFSRRITNKKLFCFGYGDQAKTFFTRHAKSGIAKRLAYIIDNNPQKSGTTVEVGSNAVRVISFDDFTRLADEESVVLVTSVYCIGMLEQLDKESILDGIDTYINIFVDSVHDKCDFEFTKGDKPKIPKKIHYCWFGEKGIPADLQAYMKTWEKFCPDYEIIRWDESNYDVTKNLYMRQSYEACKWGFVPDYARLDIIHEHGGIYLDTDVELVNSLDDLLHDEMFCGFEQSGCVNLGNGFGAVQGNGIIKRLRDVYDSASFIGSDNSLNVTPCVFYQEPILEQLGIEFNGKYQKNKNITVYPSEVLDAKNHWSKKLNITEKSLSIHHYASSWWDNAKMDEAAEKLRQNYETLLRRMEANENAR